MLFSSLLFGLIALGHATVLPRPAEKRDPHGSLARRQSDSDDFPYKIYTIDQPIDHFPDSPRYEPHTDATFTQRYIFNSTYYKPGGPVILYIGGETSLESRLNNIQTGIVKILSEAFNGLGIILENRYYGDSWPFNTSTTDHLAYLTTEQTIADNAYFAQHATFPGVKGNLSAPGTPWILYGGSLAGAQTAFSLKEYGASGTGLLWGGIASSSVIHTEVTYPQWYDPIQKFAPGDCTASINAIIDKFDYLVARKNKKAIQEFKEIFGLGALEDNRDFAMTIAFPMGGPMNYPTNTWQELNWAYPVFGSRDFWDFCRNVTNLHAPANITAVDYKLAKYTHGQPWKNLGNYAHYVQQVLLPLCPSGDYNNVKCFGTQNETYYADVTNSGNRAYLYSTCTEQGVYQVAQPAGKKSLISRVLQKDYTQQWCTWAFPPGKYNSIPDEPDASYYNKYGDYHFSAKRVAFIDGEQDVWRDVGYHSHDAPSPRYSDLEYLYPEHLIAGAGHHWDSWGIGPISAEPQFIQNAHQWELRVVEVWLRQWKEKKYKRDEL